MGARAKSLIPTLIGVIAAVVYLQVHHSRTTVTRPHVDAAQSTPYWRGMDQWFFRYDLKATPVYSDISTIKSDVTSGTLTIDVLDSFSNDIQGFRTLDNSPDTRLNGEVDDLTTSWNSLVEFMERPPPRSTTALRQVLDAVNRAERALDATGTAKFREYRSL